MLLLIFCLKERAMMSQQRLLSLPLVGTTLLCLFVGMYLFAKKRKAKSTPSHQITGHTVKKSAENTLAYWTADKMRHAQPAPLPTVNEPEGGKHAPHRSDVQ